MAGRLLAHLQGLSEALVGRYGDAGVILVAFLLTAGVVMFGWMVVSLLARAYERRAAKAAPRGCGPTSATRRVG